MADKHAPIVTLEDFDAIDADECALGYREARPGDPEPGMNRSRSYHHGWRMRMHDLGAILTPDDHRRLIRAVMDRERVARGEKPYGPWGKHDA